MKRRRSRRLLAVAVAAGLAGCGSLEPHELPPAAGPAASPAPGAPSARAGGRTFVVDRRANALDVREGGRRIARVPTALEPVAVTSLDGGRKVAVLAGRERVVELFDVDSLRRLGRAPAGIGPTHVISSAGSYLYVIDTAGGALLVYAVDPELRPTRRLYLEGGPYAAAFDRARRRIWVGLTGTNQLAELAAGARPHLLRTLPSVRAPRTVRVQSRTGRVVVTGRSATQVLDLPRSR